MSQDEIDTRLIATAKEWRDHAELVEAPLEHHFFDQCYIRGITMPAGTQVIGCKHKTQHANIVTRGLCDVLIEGRWEKIDARFHPLIFGSNPGVIKSLIIHEETQWLTVHVTPETDLHKLAGLLLENPDDHELYQARLELQTHQQLHQGA
jgi:hypothetical protein